MILETARVKRRRFLINGIVQGVGFRPFIYRIALECKLSGSVCNNSDGVRIDVQGTEEQLAQFEGRVRTESPPLSKIVSLKTIDLSPVREDGFHIDLTENNHRAKTFIPPDVCVCDDCLAELNDPSNRRFHYPFINCTNCGPRFTIIRDIPYDRPATSMAVFPLCPRCAKEYNDPGDRRFHAQPNACPECGPRLFLHNADGSAVACDDPLSVAIARIRDGQIGAIRGLGGFHLAVDAFNRGAVCELRRRKGRPGKPLAVMARDMDVIKELCRVSDAEQKLLQSPARPIVLLNKKENCNLPEEIAPGNNTLGVMLPYTPLHFMLLAPFDALVMTSGNYSDEPIAIKNDDALTRLKDIADFFLLHNREILHRCDDAIARVVLGRTRLIRRSRGYVPEPVFLHKKSAVNILACGAELKNTIMLTRGNEAFFSPHIGNLDNPAALAFFEESITHLSDVLQIKPQSIVCDMHPEYLSTKWAKKQNLPVLEVQHHHAHLAGVMAENHVMEPTIGLILDGTGYGTDGTIWGGEVLVGDFKGFERFAWLRPVAMPGGEMAVKQPWRLGLAYLMQAFGEIPENMAIPLLSSIKKSELEIVQTMIRQNINCPLTSGCGRLFDAVSAIFGLCLHASFEAEAAIRLEMILDEKENGSYCDGIETGQGPLATDALIRQLVKDYCDGIALPVLSARFHNTLADVFCSAAKMAREKYAINRVGLSGGVYQNKYFFERITGLLKKEGFDVISHASVPTNDGGLALGQTAIAAFGNFRLEDEISGDAFRKQNI